MIFKPELAAKVIDGSKSMSRRRLPCQYKVDRWYKVQPGRGKFHVCHIFVTKVREAWLSDITDADAVREGFANRHEFYRYWGELYRDSGEEERVAVIEWVVYPAVRDCCARLER